MKTTLKNYWAKSEKLRQSMPEIVNTKFLQELYGEDPEHPEYTIKDKINKYLYQYKEIKTFCKMTHIEGFYYAILIFIALGFIFVGYFDSSLTIIIATFYPLYMSFKTLQFRIGEEKADGGIYDEEDEKQNTIQWLIYWVFYSVFINLEGFFGSILKKVPFYFFFKVVFLLMCFLPQYQLANVIYTKYIRVWFTKYENLIVNYFNKIAEKFTENDDDRPLRRNKTIAAKKKRDDDLKNEMDDFIHGDSKFSRQKTVKS